MVAARTIFNKFIQFSDANKSYKLLINFSRMLGIPIPFYDGEASVMTKRLFYLYSITFITYFMVIYIICEIIQAAIDINNFNLEKVTQNFAITLAHIGGFFKILNLSVQGKRFLRLISMVDHMNARFADNDEKKQIIRHFDRTTTFVFISFNTLVSATVLLVDVILFINPEGATDNFPYKLYVPEFVPKMVKLLTMSIALGWNGLVVLVNDCLIIALMNQICAQLMILAASLEEFTEENYKAPPLKRLKECVVHHQMIINLRNEIEGIFSYMILLQFLASLFIFALIGFQATVGSYRQYNVFAYCCCASTELFIYCWFSHQVIEQSKSLGYSAFSSAWHEFGRKYCRNIQMIICQSGIPLQFSGGGFFVISLTTFSLILTRSYSYIALLRQMYYGDRI